MSTVPSWSVIHYFHTIASKSHKQGLDSSTTAQETEFEVGPFYQGESETDSELLRFFSWIYCNDGEKNSWTNWLTLRVMDKALFVTVFR